MGLALRRDIDTDTTGKQHYGENTDFHPISLDYPDVVDQFFPT